MLRGSASLRDTQPASSRDPLRAGARDLLGKALLALLSPLVAFAIVEGTLALLHWPAADALAIAAAGGGGPFEDPQKLLEPDPDLLWRFRPGARTDFRRPEIPPFTVTIGPHGLRGETPLLDAGAGPTVLCVGDSVTAGYGADDGADYPAVLRELLEARHGIAGCRVVNAGVFGYSSEQGRRALPPLLARYHPQIVVICYGQNDDNVASLQDRVALERDTRLKTAQQLLAHSRVYRGLRGVLLSWRRSRRGAPYLALHAPLSVYRLIALSAAHDEDAPFVDLPDLSGRTADSPRLFVDAGHPGPEGYCLLASGLAPVVAMHLRAFMQVGPPRP